MASDLVDSEEAIIGEFWAPLAEGFPGALGLKDDCAVIAPPPGCELVVTTDAVVAGVHLFAAEAADAFAWKALAVNVSDLVAKGAAPMVYLMSLALPEAPTRTWLADFADGLARAQKAFGCHLIGGDTDRTPGPLSISITAIGTIPQGSLVRRSTARAGDLVYVSGTIGDATLGLALRRDPALAERWKLDQAARARLEARYLKPVPPAAIAPVVRACASAAMDISDGLIKDFDRLCRASMTGGRIEAALVPLSAPARTVLTAGGASLADLLSGGEDYETLLTVAPGRAGDLERLAGASGISLTRIGSIEDAGTGVTAVDEAGRPMTFAQTGWDHFQKRGTR